MSNARNTMRDDVKLKFKGNFSPLSPVMVLQSQVPQQQQQQQQQQRIQRSRMASGSQNQATFSSNEPLLSPQPMPSPSYSQSVTSTAASTFVSVSSAGVPVTYTLAPMSQHFSFDRQNIQAFSTNSNDRSTANDQSTSGSIRQDLQSLLGSQNQLILSNSNQQLLQSLSSGSVTRVLNINSLTREELEELGLSVELLPTQADVQSRSQNMYAQALLNDAHNLENAVHPASPRVQVEEPKPADQKKSLLQQLLSEPT